MAVSYRADRHRRAEAPVCTWAVGRKSASAEKRGEPGTAKAGSVCDARPVSIDPQQCALSPCGSMPYPLDPFTAYRL